MSIEAKHAYRFEFLKSEQWKNVRIEALAREKGKCQICGEESIHNDAHHIWYPESIWDTRSEHLVILCRPCHDFLHTMMPDCKTRDEQEGKAHWLKYSNAVVSWRMNKASLFQSSSVLPPGLKPPKAATLRENYDILKKRYKSLEAVFIEYRNSFGIIEGVTIDPDAGVRFNNVVSPPTFEARMDQKNTHQKLQFIILTLRKWAGFYELAEPKQSIVDNQDYHI